MILTFPSDHLLVDIQDPGVTVLNYLFLFITQFGDEAFFLIAIPYIHWGRDRRLAIEVAAMLLTSFYINLWLKELFKVPRPPKKEWLPSWAAPDSYSFPSGHAQGVSAFWLYISAVRRDRWFVLIGTILIVLVSYSRIYLGVHRPNDVLVGLALGAIISLAFFILRRPVSVLIERMDHVQRLSLAVAIPTVMFILTGSVDNARLMGFLMGVLSGAELESTNLHMPDCRDSAQRRIRLVSGYGLCAFLMFGLGYFGPNEPGWQFLVYSLSGLGVTYFAPLMFEHIENRDTGHSTSK